MATKKPDELKTEQQGVDWAQTASDLYGQIANRPKFTYDVNNDALYQSYRDQYARNGQRAMQDTMGQAAALTGGYGSTYAQAVGQQQYNDYMTKLNAEIPNLYAQARAAYDKDTDDLYNRYNLAMTMENQEYNRGRDALDDEWRNKEWEANQAYQNWQMNRTNQQDAREYALMMIKMGQMPSQDALAATGWSLEDVQAMVNYYKQMQAASGGTRSGGSYGGGVGSGSGSGNGYETGEENPYMSGIVGAAVGATAAMGAQNISDAQVNELYQYALANGDDALISYMYQNYRNSPNFDDVLKKLKKMLAPGNSGPGYNPKHPNQLTQ